MPQLKKFIVTQDRSVGDQLIAYGFVLLSNICGTYTFVNEHKEKIDFSSIDTAKIHFTNKIYI